MRLLITGGSGTLGNALIRELLPRQEFTRIAIYSRDEEKQFRMSREYSDPRLRYHIGDVRDYDRLRFALEGVDCVIHAAALKHVPSGEANPFEHIKTNVMGSQNVVMAAATAGVKKVMGVSTDKAVEPINLYGSSKLCMERLFLAANSLGRPTKFGLVRYGNVMGSRGSFIETLEKLSAEGAKSFPLRSLESTRFWISKEDAARFVIDRLLGMEAGAIYVPKLPSSSALDFARQYLPLAEPEIVGVPRGEKIHEILISGDEWQYTEDAGEMYVIRPNGPRYPNREVKRYSSDGKQAGDDKNVGRTERRSEEVGAWSPVHYGE